MSLRLNSVVDYFQRSLAAVVVSVALAATLAGAQSQAPSAAPPAQGASTEDFAEGDAKPSRQSDQRPTAEQRR